MDDEQREIVGVIWKELGDRIQVTFADGETIRIRAGESVAAEMAREAGLTLVPTRDGMAQWVKNPDT